MYTLKASMYQVKLNSPCRKHGSFVIIDFPANSRVILQQDRDPVVFKEHDRLQLLGGRWTLACKVKKDGLLNILFEMHHSGIEIQRNRTTT